MSHRIVLALMSLAALLVGACGPDAARIDVGAVVRDSSGVRIVENGEAPVGTWRTGEAPLFTLGWGPEDPTFTWIQSGRILRDGGAVVGEYNAGTIYRLGPDGSVVATWGGKGEGPGEYDRHDGILLLGDSIVVSDAGLYRITVLSDRGELRATHPKPGAFLHEVSSVLPDGRLLLIPGDGYSAASEVRPEWVFETQPILALDLERAAVDTLAELPHLRRWYGTRGGNPGTITVRGRAAGLAGGFAWARSDRAEVGWYDAGGALTQIARWREDPAPLTAEWRADVIRVFEDAMVGSGMPQPAVTAQLTQIEQSIDLHDGPLPYWDAFLADREGNAWLRQYAPPMRPSGRWRVVARDGSYVGWVEVPDVIVILDVTRDRVLAVRLDDLDVPAVVMLELVKG